MGRPYRGSNLCYNECWPRVTVRDIANPNSEYWRSECLLDRHQFNKLPITDEEWQTFENYLKAWGPDEHTWKAVHDVIEQAVKTYQIGMEIDELAYRVGILPECGCVLPGQSCKYCRIAARVAAEVEK